MADGLPEADWYRAHAPAAPTVPVVPSAPTKASRRQQLTIVLGGLLILCVLGGGVVLIGSGHAKGGGGATAPADPGSGAGPLPTVGSGAESVPAGSADAVVRRLGLQKTDLRSGEVLRVFTGGHDVSGQVTLDYCGVAFASEALRIARYQAAADQADGTETVSVETVVYQPGGAAQAAGEMRAALATCQPNQLVASTVEGTPALRYRSTPVPEQQLHGVTADHIAVVAQATRADGRSITRYLIFQVRGRVLIGTYGNELQRVIDTAAQVGQRLGAAPSSDVAGK